MNDKESNKSMGSVHKARQIRSIFSLYKSRHLLCDFPVISPVYVSVLKVFFLSENLKSYVSNGKEMFLIKKERRECNYNPAKTDLTSSPR